MKKYNLSQIFKTAWNLVKTAGKSMSEALKAAWAQAKEKGVELETLKERLQLVCNECNKKYPGTFKIQITDNAIPSIDIDNDCGFKYCTGIKYSLEITTTDCEKIVSRWFFGHFYADTKTYIPAADKNIFDFNASIKSIIG